MMNRIYKIIIGVLFLCYLIFSGYQYYSNSKNLNDLTKTERLLKSDYRSLFSKMDSLEKSIININTEKESINNTIKEQEDNLKQINNKIAIKEAEKKKKTQGQTKPNTNNGTKLAYLTFDDGPSIYTNRVLDILKEYNIKSTFFVNGRDDTTSLNIYRRIVNEGHSIGNHTYTHKYQNIYSTIQAFDDDFNSLQNLILRTTGVTMDIMRFPGGSNNTVSNSYSSGIMNTLTARYKGLGYTYFDWNSSAGDTGAGATTTSIINKITNECRGKSYVIVLMHDSLPTTPTSLRSVIQNLSNLGFNFSSLSSSSPVIQFK